MGWINDRWDELTGRNQKVDPSVIKGEYQDAYGGARETYSWLEQQGKEMMDPNSPMNRMAKERMDTDSADTAAEMARLSGRNAAQSGGAPAGAIAAQTADTMNKAQAGSLDAFNKHLMGTYAGGASMLSGAAGNLAQMEDREMQAIQLTRQANNMIDREATMMGAGLIGGAGQTIFGLPPTLMTQRGGYIGSYQEGDEVPYSQEDYGALLHQKLEDFGAMGESNRYDKKGGYTQEHYQKLYGGQPDTIRYKDPGNYEFRLPGGGFERVSGAPPLESFLDKAISRKGFNPFEEMEMQEELSKKSPYQSGGYIYGQRGGMLSTVMGPKGPMGIKTRLGGQLIG